MTRTSGTDLPGRDHERARELAAARPGGFLEPEESAWLDAHLATCNACLAVAGEYQVQHELFSGLRGVFPEPPRDLWARTAAAIEAEGGSRSGARRGSRRRVFGSWSLAPVAAVMVIAIAVGAGLLNGLPLRESTSKGDEPDATPFALEAGEIRVLSQGEDGSLEFRRQVVSEVCPVGASTCSVNPTPEVTQTERIAGASAWDAIISPTNDQLVVVEKGDGAQGVFVVPLRETAGSSSPKPVAPTRPPATERPTEPAATPSPAPTEPAPTEPAATETPTDDASASPESSAAPSDDASAPPSDAPESAAPSDSAEPTATPAPAATPTPTPTIAVTPRPDGAIEIAHDVSIVGGSAAYSPDGSHFAFTARPIDGSAGPNVYVWRAGDAEAAAITDDNASLFSGWLGSDLLVSRVTDDGPRTFILGLDGSETSAHDGAMWRPTVAPDGRTAVWWDGSVKPSKDDGVWVPSTGRLVLETWPRGGDNRQILADGRLTDWQVRWDQEGSVLAVWTTTGAPGEPGTLSLYPVDPKTGLADLASPTLSGEAAFPGFALKTGRLTWSAPADGGDTTVQVLAWSGDKVGRVEILAEDGTTVVR